MTDDIDDGMIVMKLFDTRRGCMKGIHGGDARRGPCRLGAFVVSYKIFGLWEADIHDSRESISFL